MRRVVLTCAVVALALVLATSSVRADGGGMTLERAVRQAAERYEGPRAAVERARAADARVDRAHAGFLPDLTLKGTYTRNAFETKKYLTTPGAMGTPPTSMTTTTQHYNAFGADAALNMMLFNASAFPLLKQAKLDREAADLRATDASRLAGFDAALAFLSVLGSEQVVAAAERRVQLARTNVDEARARTAAGLAGSNDVTRAELEVASAERDLVRARGDVGAARLELGHLVGEAVDGPLVVPDALLEDARGTTPAPDTLAPSARKRLDVAAAEKSTEALEASSDEPLMRTVPTLDLFGKVRTTNETGLSAHDVDGSLGLTLTWILFDGGERYAEHDERVALARADAIDAEGLSRRAELELRGAANALRTGQATAVQAEVAVRAAEQNSRETGELYKNGLTPALAVADAVAQLFTAEVDLVRARYGVAQALLEMRRAAGFDALGKEVR